MESAHRRFHDFNLWSERKRVEKLRYMHRHDRTSSYEGHLAKFLNDYMYDNRDPTAQFLQQKRDLFAQTVDCIWDTIFSGEAATKLSLTVLEALLVGVSKNIKTLTTETPGVVRNRYRKLINHDEFSEAALREGLSKKPRVTTRLATAVNIFAGN